MGIWDTVDGSWGFGLGVGGVYLQQPKPSFLKQVMLKSAVIEKETFKVKPGFPRRVFRGFAWVFAGFARVVSGFWTGCKIGNPVLCPETRYLATIA